MRTSYDTVVIGAGPAGSHAARRIAEAGFSTLLVEEHSRVGEPIQCSGLVTPRVFSYIPKDLTEVHNEVRGAYIHGPLGKPLVVDGGGTKAIVTNRASLDRAACTAAETAGVEVVTGTRAKKAWRDNGTIGVAFDGAGAAEVRTRLLIGADGVQSGVARWFGIKRPKDLVSGVEHHVRPFRGPSDFVSVFVGRTVAPSFFGWVIPHGDHGGAVGLGTSGNSTPAVRYLERLESNPPVRDQIDGGSWAANICGVIPTDIVDRPFADGVMTVGDAAGQVKPLSGGGIFSGLACAQACAETAVRALTQEDTSSTMLSGYAEAVDATVGKELRIAYRLRKVFKHLNDHELDSLLRYFEEERLLGLVVNHGDIDYPGDLARRVVRRAPLLLRFTRPYVKSLFS